MSENGLGDGGLRRDALGWPDDDDDAHANWSDLKAARARVRPRDAIGGRYVLVERIGRGGTSNVWKACDLQTAEHVALKLMTRRSSGGAQLIERFRREVDLASQLPGSSYVRILDSGLVADRAFLVMELLEGESLQERLARQRKLTAPELLELSAGLRDALSRAHDIEIVHRDIKPGNIFYTRMTTPTGRRDCLKLLDFGIAKDLWSRSRLTTTNTFLGSQPYMSPEQVRSGRTVDTSADLWSTAVVLYRSLTGALPFPGEGLEAAKRIGASSFPSPSQLLNTEARALDAFFAKAFARDPSKRFETIDELCVAFAAAIHNAAPLARSPARSSRESSWDPKATQCGPEGYRQYAERASSSDLVVGGDAETPTAIIEPGWENDAPSKSRDSHAMVTLALYALLALVATLGSILIDPRSARRPSPARDTLLRTGREIRAVLQAGLRS